MLTGLVSGTVASIVTSSVFVFGGDFIDQGKGSVNESTQKAGVEQTENVEKDRSVTAEKLSTSTDSNDRAKMVESASKSIVGVVNLQEMQNQDPFQQQSTKSETVASGTGSGVIFKRQMGRPISLRTIMLLREQRKSKFHYMMDKRQLQWLSVRML